MTGHPLLLVEPNALLRQTVALTAGSIGAGPVVQTSSIGTVRRMMQEQAFAGAMLSLDSNENAAEETVIEVIEAFRSGASLSSADLPIYITASACSRTTAQRLYGLKVQRILIKPFRARLLIETLEGATARSGLYLY